jgi:hypothetical protein
MAKLKGFTAAKHPNTVLRTRQCAECEGTSKHKCVYRFREDGHCADPEVFCSIGCRRGFYERKQNAGAKTLVL